MDLARTESQAFERDGPLRQSPQKSNTTPNGDLKRCAS
jgi:hypothetical protein